jgi:hypothetical protein
VRRELCEGKEGGTEATHAPLLCSRNALGPDGVALLAPSISRLAKLRTLELRSVQIVSSASNPYNSTELDNCGSVQELRKWERGKQWVGGEERGAGGGHVLCALSALSLGGERAFNGRALVSHDFPSRSGNALGSEGAISLYPALYGSTKLEYLSLR